MKNAIEKTKELSAILKGKRIGLITNPTGVNARLIPSGRILGEFCRIGAYFGPEHGLSGVAEAGVKVASDRNGTVPVYSMYDKESICGNALDGLDMLVYDIADVGLRFYTYIYTLAECMTLARDAKIPILVLDRMNPLGLSTAEGTLLDEEFSSGVGRYELPTRYAMTAGEFARYINAEKGIGCELRVLECDGLSRPTSTEGAFDTWVPPSPNIPTFDSVYAYAATCLFEGTSLSEGRGTAKPFEQIGAPWLRADEIVEAMQKKNLPGVLFRSVSFKPTMSKHKDSLCSGVAIHVTDRRSFKTTLTGLTLLDCIRKTHEEFEFLYWPKNDVYFIDHLLGSDTYRRESPNVVEYVSEEQVKVEAFMRRMEKYMLY